MPTFTIDDNAPILVEFTDSASYSTEKTMRGMGQVPGDIVERSEQAIDSAMNTIHNMAQRVKAAIDAISDRPDTVEVAFGLKLGAGAGALIANTNTEASINVKMIWERKEKLSPVIPPVNAPAESVTLTPWTPARPGDDNSY